MTERAVPKQKKHEFDLTVQDLGKIRVKVFDRITIDDITLHLINKRVFEVLSGESVDYKVTDPTRDFLVRERLRMR